MARPIWNGSLSFGLLNIPVALMAGERRVDLHFRMLDNRDKSPIRYERVNADTGEEVPWKEIVKAFEYKKGSYIVLAADDVKSAAAQAQETIDVETFVDEGSVSPEYFEKPYVLVPGKKAEKGYVLLRETLRKTGKIGIARVVIRTRGYLSAVVAQGDALWLILLRYRQELVDIDDYALPEGKLTDYRISAKEIDMASQLVESMASSWEADAFHDEFRERLRQVIEKRLKSKGAAIEVEDAREEAPSANVVDFMALLKKSVANNKRTPPKQPEAKKPAARKRASRKH